MRKVDRASLARREELCLRSWVENPDRAGCRDRVPVRMHLVQVGSFERPSSLFRLGHRIRLCEYVSKWIESKLGVQEVEARVRPTGHLQRDVRPEWNRVRQL